MAQGYNISQIHLGYNISQIHLSGLSSTFSSIITQNRNEQKRSTCTTNHLCTGTICVYSDDKIQGICRREIKYG